MLTLSDINNNGNTTAPTEAPSWAKLASNLGPGLVTWQARKINRRASTGSIMPIKELGVPPVIGRRSSVVDLISYNKQIATAAREKDIQKTRQIFNSVLAEGLQPNAYSYTPLIQVTGQLEGEQAARTVLDEMRERGIRPTLIAYNMQLSFYVKKEQEAKALEIWEMMKKDGVKPDKFTYTTLLNLYVRKREEERALEVFEMMQKEGIKPDEVTYNVLINLYIKLGRFKDAFTCVTMMREEGLKPTAVTYATLLDFHLKKGQTKQALHVLEMMDQDEIVPDEVTIQLLINLLVAVDKIELAQELFNEEMMHSHISVEGQTEVLDCHGLSHGGACILLKKYVDKRQETSFFIVISGIGKHSKSKEKFLMQHVILAFVQSQCPHLKATVDEKNKGRINVIYKEKSGKEKEECKEKDRLRHQDGNTA